MPGFWPDTLIVITAEAEHRGAWNTREIPSTANPSSSAIEPPIDEVGECRGTGEGAGSIELLRCGISKTFSEGSAGHRLRRIEQG